MIANTDKFQAIVPKRNNKIKYSYRLNINQEVINFENCLKLLGVEINKNLSFEKHISTQVKKTHFVKQLCLFKLQSLSSRLTFLLSKISEKNTRTST